MPIVETLIHLIVDFEKMKGIPGIIMSNQVTNTDELKQFKDKKIRSLISFDEGSTWETLKAPTKDSNGDPIDCQSQSVHSNPRKSLYCLIKVKHSVI